LGWYRAGDKRYEELLPTREEAEQAAKGKEKAHSTDLHSPRDPTKEESKDDLPLGIQVKESPVEESPVSPPVRRATPMPGEWKINLKE
jgi:hypothetical protein